MNNGNLISEVLQKAYLNKQAISDYIKKFQKKNQLKRKFFRSGPYMLSRFITEELINKTGKTNTLNYCLNSAVNIYKQIIENEQNIMFTSEALIKTYPTNKFANFIKQALIKNVSKPLLNLKFSDIETNGSSDKLIDTIEMEQPTNCISPAITFVIPIYTNDTAKCIEISKKITDLAWTCGYYLTAFETYEHDLRKDVEIRLAQFEAKFPQERFKFTKYLMHVSPLKYLEKIRKHGLVPYAKSNEFAYDGRVYLFNSCPEETVLSYALFKAKQANDSGFCIFKLSSDKLVNSQKYKNGKMTFYVDPQFNFDGKQKVEAIFTYNNVDKPLLENVFAKYTIAADGKISRMFEKL